jgi:hypothetical protein
VHATIEDGPCDLAGVLALQEQSFGFVRGEAEDLRNHRVEDIYGLGLPILSFYGGKWRMNKYLGVAADEESPLAGVDLVVREGINLDLLLARIKMRMLSMDSDSARTI